VAPNVVLTAGHCDSAAWRFDVIIGTTNAGVGGETFKVSRVVRDPHFRQFRARAGELTDFDAALLQLTTPTTAPAVRLAPAANKALYKAGTSVSVAGWGWLTYASDTTSQTLQAAKMALRSESACSSDAKAVGLVLDTADQVCALSLTRATGICEGDSGGPLIATGAHGDPVEIGITIWNSGDCTTRAPDYFTGTAAISGWLTHEIAVLSDAYASGAGRRTGAQG
jgi:secreted trypsin-like serine protease